MAANRKHWFWTDHPSSHCFFKVLMKGFDRRLALPMEFFARFQVKLSAVVALKGPGGDTWNVRLTRSMDQLFLENGWPQFVSNNSLEEFDFLVFRYDGKNDQGNSQFRVLAFDKTGCEKDGLGPVDIGDDSRSNTDEAEAVKEGSGSSKSPTYYRYFKSHRRPVSQAEIARALRSALTVESSSTKPHFVKVMKASIVYKKFFMTMPLAFLKEHFPQPPKSVVLRVSTKPKTWAVHTTHTAHGAGLNGGWSSFVLDNNLEEGDACLFELNVGQETQSSNSNVIFDVSIFRVVEQIVPMSKMYQPSM